MLKTERRINIAFYRYSLFNRGGDRLIVEYANHLASLGHTVTLYVREIKSVFKLDSRVIVKNIPYPSRLGALVYGATHRLAHDVIVVDIIHLPLALSLRNRVIYYAQADDREYYSGWWKRKTIEHLYRLHFRSEKPVISMSQHLTDIFQKRYNFTNKYTITTGIDHRTFYPDPEPSLIERKNNRKAIVFMARGDSFRKGFDIGLKTFDELYSIAPGAFEVWICGNHLEEEKFSYPIRNFGIVNDDCLRQILSSADVFLYPSRHEGFGLFPLEAMACGCAVVTTKAIPYAQGSKAIFCSEIEDSSDLTRNLMLLILDTALLKIRKKNGIQEADLYDLERSKSEFESTLCKIINGRYTR